MLKFRKKEVFERFFEEANDITKTTYEDIIKFSEKNRLSYGIISYDEDNDTLYVKTNTDQCFIATNGEAQNCKGKYLTFVENEDYEFLNKSLNEDANIIINGKLDIACINKPFVNED